MRGEAELAPRLLLQCRGDERRVRLVGEGLFCHLRDAEGLLAQRFGQLRGIRRQQMRHGGSILQLPRGVDEVSTRRHRQTTEFDEARRKFAATVRGEIGLQIPVLGLTETHAQAFALHHQTCRHGLNTSGRQLRLDLAPQDR